MTALLKNIQKALEVTVMPSECTATTVHQTACGDIGAVQFVC